MNLAYNYQLIPDLRKVKDMEDRKSTRLNSSHRN